MTRHGQYVFRHAFALFGLSVWGVTCALGADRGPIMPKHPLDTSFLREGRLSKQKNWVDLSAITDPDDMQIIRGAIDQIITFIIATNYARPPAAPIAASAFTDGAQFRLRIPPHAVVNGKDMRLFRLRVYDWAVINGKTIIVSVDFGLSRTNPRYTDRFVFVLQDGAWRFARHDWDQPKVYEK